MRIGGGGNGGDEPAWAGGTRKVVVELVKASGKTVGGMQDE
jgi:hypothetical protein